MIKGKVWKFRDDVNTDEIIPARYLNTTDERELAAHCMEDIDAGFAKKVKKGDIVAAGKNFGCGSSREQPALGLKAVGVQAIVARSFARIFYRAAINQGLLLVECPDAVEAFKEGDKIELDAKAGQIKVGQQTLTFPKLPAEILAISEAGGLLPYTRAALKKR